MRNRKKLLILAAATYQLPFIVRAREAGIEVITADNRPTNPGHALADRSYCVDTTDVPGLLALAQDERVDGILAACTDVALEAAAAVGQCLGLTAPPPSAVRTVCDKIAFRSWQRSEGLPAPEAHVITDTAEAPLPAGTWVLKPDRSSGSKGTFIVRSEAELRARLPDTLTHSPTGQAIAERFLHGQQVTCEGVLERGRVRAFWVLDRQVAPPPHVATIGHHVPTRLPPSSQTALRRSIEDLWSRLDVTSGPFDCDAIVDGEDVWLIEATPRVGGNSITRLLHIAWDVDIVDYTVRHALGMAPGAPSSGAARPAALLILGADRSGVLEYDEDALASLQREPWVVALTLDARRGDPVCAFIDGRHRVGEAVVVGVDRDQVDARASMVRERLRIRAV